jgi:hypothetical protein
MTQIVRVVTLYIISAMIVAVTVWMLQTLGG